MKKLEWQVQAAYRPTFILPELLGLTSPQFAADAAVKVLGAALPGTLMDSEGNIYDLITAEKLNIGGTQ